MNRYADIPSLRRKEQLDDSDINDLLLQIQNANAATHSDDDVQDDGNNLDISLDENIGNDFDSESESDSDLETNHGDIMEQVDNSDIGDSDYNNDFDNDQSALYDNQEVVTESSSAFDKVVSHIMAKKGYKGQSLGKIKPSTLSCPASKEVPLNRFPTNQYVTQKLANMRDALKNAATTVSVSGIKKVQKFFKPPPFLDRVSELGDSVKSTESSKAPQKSVSATPDEWTDILNELKVSNKMALGKAFLQPPETRSVELAATWGTKVLNYVDHFANHAQGLQSDTSSYMEIVKQHVISTATKPDGTLHLPKEVSSALSKMESKQKDSIFCLQEMANLIPSAMDCTIYTQATMELHRRDDLLSMVSSHVGSNALRDLRLSTFGTNKMFSQEACLKAGKQISKKVKSGEIVPGKQRGNFRGRRGRGRVSKRGRGGNNSGNSYNKQPKSNNSNSYNNDNKSQSYVKRGGSNSRGSSSASGAGSKFRGGNKRGNN